MYGLDTKASRRNQSNIDDDQIKLNLPAAFIMRAISHFTLTFLSPCVLNVG
jgi:hypothetical protein